MCVAVQMHVLLEKYNICWCSFSPRNATGANMHHFFMQTKNFGYERINTQCHDHLTIGQQQAACTVVYSAYVWFRYDLLTHTYDLPQTACNVSAIYVHCKINCACCECHATYKLLLYGHIKHLSHSSVRGYQYLVDKEDFTVFTSICYVFTSSLLTWKCK